MKLTSVSLLLFGGPLSVVVVVEAAAEERVVTEQVLLAEGPVVTTDSSFPWNFLGFFCFDIFSALEDYFSPSVRNKLTCVAFAGCFIFTCVA